MGDLRLYDESFLMELANKGQDGKEELERKLAMVKCNEDLTNEEKDENIDRINYALNGGQKFTRKDVEEDIKAGAADTDDMGGMN